MARTATWPRPCPGSVWVAGAVVAGRRWDPLGGEPFGDGVGAVAGQEQLKDVSHDFGGGRVGLQPVPAGADGGLGGVGVGAGVDQPVLALGLVEQLPDLRFSAPVPPWQDRISRCRGSGRY